jgi:hypothetical protein
MKTYLPWNQQSFGHFIVKQRKAALVYCGV